jgi:hypothetical protein
MTVWIGSPGALPAEPPNAAAAACAGVPPDFLPMPWNETVSLGPPCELAPPGRLVDWPDGVEAFFSPPSQPPPDEHAPRKAKAPAIRRRRFMPTV